MFLPQTKTKQTMQKKHEGHEENCGCDVYVHYLDCGGSHIDAYVWYSANCYEVSMVRVFCISVVPH